MKKVDDENHEKFYRAISKHSMDAIAILTLEGDFLHVTPAIDMVLGYTPAEAHNLNVFSLTHQEDIKYLTGIWEKMLREQGMAIPVQTFRMKHKDGTWRWIASSVKNILDDPEVYGILYTFKDITVSVVEAKRQSIDKSNLEALINNTSEIMWSVDRDYNLITANKAFVEVIEMITGNTVSKGDTIFIEGFPKEDYIKNKQILDSVFEGKVFTEAMYTDKPTEGWSEIKYYPIWDNQVVIGAACHSKNITSIKLAERKNQFDKNNIEALINSTGDMMWSLDRELNLIVGNQPFIDMLRKFIGKDLIQGEKIFIKEVPPEISQELVYKFEGNYQRALAGEGFSVVEHFEFPQEMWLQISYHPIKLDDVIIGVACHSQDKTKDVRAEQKRIRNEERLKESQALAKLGHWELNFETGVALWSDEACRIYGLPIENNLHTFENWLSFIYSDDMEVVMSAIEAVQISKGDLELNHRILLHDGSIKHIASKTIFEYDETGKIPVGLYGVVFDITAKKDAEIKLKQKAMELVQSNAELEQFAYAVTHDLQEPLRMVTSFLGQLEKKYDSLLDDKGKQYIHFAVDGAKRMRQIIIDMLEYSKVGKISEECLDVDLNEVINGINILLSNQINDKKAIIQYENLPIVRSNKTPIQQVFQNLIANGLKYSAEGVNPHIKIDAIEELDHWTLSVSDNGIGINEEYFEKIFVIFQRLHTRDEYAGTGIGLATTKKIVEHLGGRIWLQSEEGKGSVFYFTLPK